ncbi:MAG: glycoside hydrolase family 88/105 protein, partial [Bacteroides sp.]
MRLFITKTMNTLFTLAVALITLMGISPQENLPSDADLQTHRQTVLELANRVGETSLKQYHDKAWGEVPFTDWRSGVLMKGLYLWAQQTANVQLQENLLSIAAANHYRLDHRLYHADDLCITQSYLLLNSLSPSAAKIEPTMLRIDSLLTHPYKPKNKEIQFGLWWWSDALFMAPPVFAQLYELTANETYLDFCYQEFRSCYEHLYNKSYGLFYRDKRFIPKSGTKPVFWSRGNGWVVGGLVSLLQYIPKEHSSYPFYQSLFVDMCQSIRELQHHTGFWPSDLLDESEDLYPESSGTGLFVYALSYGVNQGYLDKNTYLASIQKGWQALSQTIQTSGEVGWVQQVAHAPGQTKATDTELYGAGIFLLAASEYIQLMNH